MSESSRPGPPTPGPDRIVESSPRLVLAPQDSEHAAEVARMRRVWLFGALIWASSGGLDAVTSLVVGEGRLWYFLALRGVELLVILAGVLRLSARPTPGPREVVGIDVLGNTLACVMVGLMCLEYRGLASPYAHGVSCILVARGITLAEPWRRGLLRVGTPAAAFPLTLAAGLLARGQARQLSDPRALGIFAQNLTWIFSTAGLLIFGGHVVWSLRRQIVEARSVGRYRLKERLGSGGMGEVWKAHYPALRQDVAVKILRPELSAGAEMVTRFEREVRAMTMLKHPSTVRVFDYGVTPDGLWYYAMELLSGETLRAVVQRGPLPVGRALRVVRQVARALAEAHEMGVIHRDIKPDNIFLARIGPEADVVKVLDFGIAKILSTDDGSQTLTEAGLVMGTPLFMAPEQASGQPASAASDLYSLGAVLYFALTGEPPFSAPSSAALLLAHLSQAPSAPSLALGAPLPPGLDAFVLRCLEKEPERRYTSAAGFIAALDACLRAAGGAGAEGEEATTPASAAQAVARAAPAGHTTITSAHPAPEISGEHRRPAGARQRGGS